MGCDGACAAGFDLVFIGLPLLSLYEIPMLIWFIWRAFHWKRDDKDWAERHGDSCNCGGRSGAPLAVGLVCPSAVGLVCVD
ncbi:hypothetical protein SAMN04489749_1103 [Bifidobacterium longum]|uniref:Uncharacterized protein n=1 Tax=Bifidobacterium longum subsp. suis TaxID=1695 RepID=A0A087BA89_BIFLN|nr:hypothetical protein BLSS_1907 [Bifidobacterium longum subsp. suis]SDO50095.1 hypothetical protein SAMN04489749_1103 [Bifidobacterium longum]